MLLGNPLPWLLEDDPENPGVRYFNLRFLLDQPEDSAEARHVRKAIMENGSVPRILAAQRKS